MCYQVCHQFGNVCDPWPKIERPRFWKCNLQYIIRIYVLAYISRTEALSCMHDNSTRKWCIIIILGGWMTLMEKKNAIVFGAHIMNINEVTRSNSSNCNNSVTVRQNFFKLGMVLLVVSQQLLIYVTFDIMHIYEGAGFSIISLTIVCMHNNSRRKWCIVTILGGWMTQMEKKKPFVFGAPIMNINEVMGHMNLNRGPVTIGHIWGPTWFDVGW